MSEVQRIVLRMQGGFCNRLRAIVSGVLWAEDLKCSLQIYWPVEPGHMACAFEEIIEPSSIPYLTLYRPAYLVNARQVLCPEDMKLVVEKFCTENEVRIQSYSEFHSELRKERGLTVLRNIRFATELYREAELQWRIIEGSSDRIGVHFRGTDHVKCLRASPISSFFTFFDSLHGSPPLVLVTDEQSVKEEFLSRYGRIVVGITNLELGRRTSRQQKAGVVEWLLLQKCGSIVGSLGSSYSELAALRAGCPYTPISSETVAILGELAAAKE